MKKFRDISILYKIVIINSVFILLLIITGAALFIVHEKEETIKHLNGKGKILSDNLAHDSSLALLSKNKLLMNNYIEGVLQATDVSYVAVYLADETLFMSKSNNGFDDQLIKSPDGLKRKDEDEGSYYVFPDLIEVSAHVYSERAPAGREEFGLAEDITASGNGFKDVIGVVIVGLSTEGPAKEIRSIKIKMAIISFMLFLVGTAANILFSRQLSKPITSLSRGARKVANGNLEVRFDVLSSDEVGVLAGSFNHMIESLNTMITTIKRSNSEITAVFDSITDYIWVTDMDCKIMRANKVFAKMSGMGMKELAGKSCKELGLFDENFCNCCYAEGGNQASHISSTVLDYLDHENGKSYQLTTFPVFSEQKVIAYVHYMTDITDKKKMEEQLVQSEKLAAMGRIAANVAHEVNNPLAIIKNYIAIIKLEMEEDGIDAYEHLDVIDGEIMRIVEIIKGLLTFSRPEANEATFCDVKSTINEFIPLIEVALENSGVKIETELDDTIPQAAFSSNHLKQVLLNLVNNAKDAMPDGGTLKIVTGSCDEGVLIKVEDSGQGISEDGMKEAFSPFYTTKGVKGFGLGLSISYGLVKQKGGDLKLEEMEDRGVRATVFLPYKKEEAHSE